MTIQYQYANPWPIHQPNANLGTNHPSTYLRPISQTMTKPWAICQSLANQTNQCLYSDNLTIYQSITNGLSILGQSKHDRHALKLNPVPIQDWSSNPIPIPNLGHILQFIANTQTIYQSNAHVLAHFVKSFRAYNVKLSSTLFLGNMLSNFEISFPNARFLIQLGYNLITISWDYQEWDFSDPSIIKSKKHSFKCVVLLWKTLIRVSIEF